MYSFFSRRQVEPERYQMLNEILSTFGYSRDAYRSRITNLPDKFLHALWKNKASFQLLVQHHHQLIDSVLLLTLDNLNAFFCSATMGFGGNAEEVLKRIMSQVQYTRSTQPNVHYTGFYPYQPPMNAHVPSQPPPGYAFHEHYNEYRQRQLDPFNH